jgi:hypothetical protein
LLPSVGPYNFNWRQRLGAEKKQGSVCCILLELLENEVDGPADRFKSNSSSLFKTGVMCAG